MSRDPKGGTTVTVDLAEAVAEYAKYSGWPELKESIMGNRVKAAYLLAPMAMDLADSGVPVKIVALGHRSGAVIMVGKDAPVKSMKDLKGQRVAIPSRFAVDHLFVRRMLKDEGMTPKDIQMVEMAPPDMPAALYAGSVAAYATGEPFGAVAEKAGYARPLFMTRDKWPDYICCVLTVRDELIRQNPALVQRLVDHVVSAGAWLEAADANRDLAAEVAAGPKVFNQKPDILKFVLNNPRDRVTYGDLKIVRKEFEEMMRLSLEAGVLKRPVAYEKYVDQTFSEKAKRVEIRIAK
jgi:NitT/TauT family transport system substrate-binding protein